MTKNTSKTMIEELVEKADNDEYGGGYHIDAVFPDGSRVNAPITKVGPNWASFSEINDEEVMVDVTGAVIKIDWMPGTAFATGERFEHLQHPEGPKM